ncbi:hypothetical protein KOR34_10530 [Posidoniimonas corsicana]|uniref:Uncharacterized protein n=1 Tax=Posidoniimonas corsicana TaxID=1938618 RepID=A0A5C5VC09_9BACT|nr:hypothetical protein [Posidoniimonas corsicana]TWT36154.1 hypothetical protein KOR34_10530 [Posidoniimonas corsicana]
MSIQSLPPAATDAAAAPSPAVPAGAPAFVDRRSGTSGGAARERRQFANSHSELSADAAELARAIDGYKLQHRRRFINADELLVVVKSLGYAKQQ